MEKINRQIVGIDIAGKNFKVCFKEISTTGKMKIKGSRSFENKSIGFKKLICWCEERKEKCNYFGFVMEATGVYYENLAYFLTSNGFHVHVLLPNKVKHFAKSLNIKTKTDKVDADVIATLGLERVLDQWTPPSTQFKKLRDLSRELQSLKQQRSQLKCQIHAINVAHQYDEFVMKLKNEQLIFIEKQIELVMGEIIQFVKKDPELEKQIDRVAMIPGLGIITIVGLLAETNGFALIKNVKQLVSYAGLDVVENQSGEFTGKTRISKKGNARIRSILYMPALSAKRANPQMKIFAERVLQNRKLPKKATTAVMRKLLILTYTFWKDESRIYNPSYQIKTGTAAPALDRSSTN